MNEPTKPPFAVRLRPAVAWLARIVVAATVIIALQMLTAFVFGVLPMTNWYIATFLFSGLVSFFGSISLLVFRRAAVWLLPLAVSLLGWLLVYLALPGIGIARMH